MMVYALDSRIAETSLWLANLPLSELRLKNQRHYPWCILIPRLPSVTELYQLSLDQQQQLMQEITQVSKMMHTQFKPLKLNVASLGNVVSQLHIHIVARYAEDALWPQGIWQSGQEEEPYLDSDLARLTTELSLLCESIKISDNTSIY